MLIIRYLVGGFVPGKLLFFFPRGILRHWRGECFVETLVCNFSVLSDFISLQGIFSGLDLWALYIVSATKRTFCHQAHWKASCLSFCYSVVSRCSLSILESF